MIDCGIPLPGFVGPAGPLTCGLPSGHAGGHVVTCWTPEAQPQAQVRVPIKCPHCQNIFGRYTWVTTEDGKARVHYCEMCMAVLNVEAIGER